MEAVQWHNGQGSFGRTTSLATSFGATYWPWVKVYDEYNSTFRWIAPSGPVAGAIAYNDAVAYPWYAPAGGDRGKLPSVSGVATTPTQGQRDYMQSGLNCVNPIVNYAGEGVMIYGQKTCYRYTTALNRINVRRMVMWITSNGSSSLRRLIFDPNDSSTWKLAKDVLEPLCRFVKKNRGLNDYLIVCDDTNNTATTIANYQLIVDVYLKPVLAAEQIHLRFTLTSQDANFEELLGA
jgi:phage tail sheath protein FI